jgi:hypothetical protein
MLTRGNNELFKYVPKSFLFKFLDFLNISLIRKKSDTTQFLWVTIGPTYKLTTGKLSVQYALFTCLSICSFWFFNFEYSN